MRRLFGNSLTKHQHQATRNYMNQVFTNLQVSQEFAINDSNEISAILFKYGRPSSIARLSQPEWKAMGWKYIEDSSPANFWRYDRGHDTYIRRLIFKVDIDGKVMDLWSPNDPVSEEA